MSLPSVRSRALAVMSAVLLSSGAVLAAALLFHRPIPPAAGDTGGVIVGSDSLTLEPTALQWKLLKLGVARRAAARWTDALPARVKVDESRVSNVGAPLAGRVNAVFVELGQRIKAGSPLFSIASPDIASLRAERSKAEVDLSVAKANLERVKAMVAARAMAAKEQVAVEQQHRQAELAYRLAISKLAALRVASKGDNEFTVTARRDGVVVEKNVLSGQEVSPESGKPLIMIADLSSVWVLADLPEVDALQVKAGAPAMVTSPSLPQLAIRGEVDMISSVVDPERHTIPIRVRLSNEKGLLKPNMYAQVKFSIEPQGDLVEVPVTALVTDGERQYVFVQRKPGQLSRRKVLATGVGDNKVIILSGLRVGETLVVEGAILLDNHLALTRH